MGSGCAPFARVSGASSTDRRHESCTHIVMADKRSTAADILIETLIRWNVDVVFGMPGDGINGIVEALRVRQDRIRFVVARHEEAAAFMACAYAKWTGRLGCCLATTGPGGVHPL